MHGNTTRELTGMYRIGQDRERMLGGLACYAFGILRILHIPANPGLAIVNLVTRQPWWLANHLHIEFEGAFDQALRAVKPERELPSLV